MFLLFISLDGIVTRIDGFILIIFWVFSIFIIQVFGGERYSVEESSPLGLKSIDKSWTVLGIILGFMGIGIGSYLVVESLIELSDALGVSEFFISFFALSIGTSLPELVVATSSIRKRYYELAIGDIIGSCVVDLTIAVGLSALVNPLTVKVEEIRLIGGYSVLIHLIAIGLLAYRRVNDKKSGAILLALYLSSWLFLFLF